MNTKPSPLLGSPNIARKGLEKKKRAVNAAQTIKNVHWLLPKNREDKTKVTHSIEINTKTKVLMSLFIDKLYLLRSFSAKKSGAS